MRKTKTSPGHPTFTAIRKPILIFILALQLIDPQSIIIKKEKKRLIKL